MFFHIRQFYWRNKSQLIITDLCFFSFLDLIFVGVAFRTGAIIKSAIFSCDEPGSQEGSDDNGSASSEASGGSHRRGMAGAKAR